MKRIDGQPCNVITTIYGLTDPRTDAIRYVGKTSNPPEERRNRHIFDAPRIPCHRSNWILSLLKQGLEPGLCVLEVVEGEQWAEREQWWIEFLDAYGFPLTNLTKGGEGFYRLSEETKAKIAQNRTPPSGEVHADRMREWWAERTGSGETGRVVVPCGWCGKEVEGWRYALTASKSGHLFCSRACGGHYSAIPLRNEVVSPCSWCGETVVRPAKQLRRSRSGNLFCSKSHAALYQHKYVGAPRCRNPH